MLKNIHHGVLSINPNLPKTITSRSIELLNNTVNPPMQNNKSVKEPFANACDVQKNRALRVGSNAKYSTQLHLVLYLSLDFTLRAAFSIHHS